MLIGGFSVQGGEPGLKAAVFVPPDSDLMFSWLEKLRDRKVMRVTPDDATSGNPTATSLSLWPWYDPTGSANQFTVGSTTTTTVGGSTTTTVTVDGASPGWVTNVHAGRIFTVVNWTESGAYATVGFHDRVTVLSNTGNQVTFAGLAVAPTVGAPCFVGEGQFNDYVAAPGWLHSSELGVGYSTRGGSKSNGSIGVGPDATLVRRLLELTYDASPYCAVWKVPIGISTIVGYSDSSGNTARDTLEAELVRVTAAATARGNTIAWKHAILDQSTEDVKFAAVSGANALQFIGGGASPSYDAALREMIVWLRGVDAMNNASAEIHIVNHLTSLYATTAAGAVTFANSVHRSIAADTAGVRVIDLNQHESVIRFADQDDTPGSEKKYYAVPSYFFIGDKMAESVRNANLGVATTTEGGFPVYALIGDSIAVGLITTTWTTESHDVELTGVTHGNLTRPSNQLKYNRGSAVLEIYVPHTNSNTSGTVNTLAGPDLSIMAELGKLHPNGFGLIKRASSGSALAKELTAYVGGTGAGGTWLKSVAAEHYDEFLADVSGCLAYVNTTLAQQADFRGLFVILGTNDAATAGGGAAFTAALSTFCNDLWEDISTRTGGDKFPIIWRRPQTDAASAIAVEVAAIRAALVTQAAAETQFRWTDVDDLAREHADNLHETPDSSVEDGRRMITTLAAVAI